MLRKPDAGDWLMIRRDYFASDYSPLNQITKDNVKNLEQVFRHPMNEGGTNQPAPIVHNGIIYLANTGGIMQAIDGLNGKVIWENHLGTNIAMRGISIYGDKLYLAAGNKIIALDARNGKLETEIWSGYSNSSGRLSSTAKSSRDWRLPEVPGRKMPYERYDAQSGNSCGGSPLQRPETRAPIPGAIFPIKSRRR
jgi:alcohol dehydrogenase (cytochrome c)